MWTVAKTPQRPHLAKSEHIVSQLAVKMPMLTFGCATERPNGYCRSCCKLHFVFRNLPLNIVQLCSAGHWGSLEVFEDTIDCRLSRL